MGKLVLYIYDNMFIITECYNNFLPQTKKYKPNYWHYQNNDNAISLDKCEKTFERKATNLSWYMIIFYNVLLLHNIFLLVIHITIFKRPV